MNIRTIRNVALPRRPATEPLTQREMDVWRATAEGLTVREIAARLGLSKSTVGQYRKTTYDKLGVDNAVRATLAAVACGVVTPAFAIAPTVLQRGHRPP